jgi:hypothetical protein
MPEMVSLAEMQALGYGGAFIASPTVRADGLSGMRILADLAADVAAGTGASWMRFWCRPFSPKG